MPRLTIWFYRTSLVYLALGVTFGGLLLFNKGFPYFPSFWNLLPSHIEFVLFGWVAQLAMGVSFSLLPRFSKPPVRGNENPAWGAYILVNVGIWMVVIASFWLGNHWLTLAGRAAETAAILAFAIHAWPRVKGYGVG